MSRLLLLLAFMAAPLFLMPAQADDACTPVEDLPGTVCAGLAYVDDGADRQILDLYLPDEAMPQTIVLILHGGGFASGGHSTESVLDLVNLMLVHDYAVASATYRFQPADPFPAQVEDAFCALAWVYAQGETYGYDPQNVFLLGDSAGGLLVNLLATLETPADVATACELDAIPDGRRASGVMALAGPSDISATGYDNRVDMIPQDQPEDFYQRFSPLYQVTSDRLLPPFLLIHGEDDAIVPVSESENFADVLEAAQARVELVTLPGADHAWYEWSRRDQRVLFGAMLFFIADILQPAGSRSA
jgi:acetyl esterase/lipase